MKKLLSVKEVSKLLGISKVAVIKQIKAGKIRGEKVGNSFVIEKDSLIFVSDRTLSKKQKSDIEKAVSKTIKDYGETLRLLKES